MSDLGADTEYDIHCYVFINVSSETENRLNEGCSVGCSLTNCNFNS